MAYTYHFHALISWPRTEEAKYDGIYGTRNPIKTENDYKLLKKWIFNRFRDQDVHAGIVRITNLSRIN